MARKEIDLAIGGDQGGSIRIPSSWCGIVGLKPTFGLVPSTGIASIETTIDHTGPMARTVKECALLLEVCQLHFDLDPLILTNTTQSFMRWLLISWMTIDVLSNINNGLRLGIIWTDH